VLAACTSRGQLRPRGDKRQPVFRMAMSKYSVRKIKRVRFDLLLTLIPHTSCM